MPFAVEHCRARRAACLVVSPCEQERRRGYDRGVAKSDERRAARTGSSTSIPGSVACAPGGALAASRAAWRLVVPVWRPPEERLGHAPPRGRAAVAEECAAQRAEELKRACGSGASGGVPEGAVVAEERLRECRHLMRGYV